MVVGYDARFLSRRYGELVVERLTGMGIPVWLSDAAYAGPFRQVVDRKASWHDDYGQPQSAGI